MIGLAGAFRSGRGSLCNCSSPSKFGRKDLNSQTEDDMKANANFFIVKMFAKTTS